MSTLKAPPTSDEFPERLAEARRAAGYRRQEDLADAVPCEQQTVSKWETGKSTPGLRYLPRLDELLDLEPGTLYDWLFTPSRGETPWSLFTPSHLGKRTCSFSLAGAAA